MEKKYSFTTDLHGYVCDARLHDKVIINHSYSEDDQVFQLYALGQNVSVEVRFEGVTKIAMRNFINGTICEGLYAWTMRDSYYIDSTFSRKKEAWNLLFLHFSEDIEERKNLAHSIVDEHKEGVLAYLACDIYGGDAVIICNDIHCVVNDGCS